MAHITADRVRQTSTSIGTGSIVLSGSLASFRDFSAVLAVNDTFWYAIASYPGSEWEVGLGTYTSANTFTRTTVLASSNAGAAVTFSTGTKEVFITAAASKFLQADAAGNYGIGTSSPTEKLSVEGNIDTRGTGYISASRAIIPTGVDQGTPALQFRMITTGSSYAAGAEIRGLSSDAWSASSSPMYLSFRTTASGSTTPTERLRLDSSGNLGLGVPPSAWISSIRAVDVSSASAFWGYLFGGTAPRTQVTNNAYLNSAGNYIYKVSGDASEYQQLLGQHRWYTAPSGTAGAAITFTQAMTLDASGNLGLGVTPSAWAGGLLGAQVSYAALSGNTAEANTTHNANYNSGWKYISSGYATRYLQASGAHSWHTAPSGTAGTAITFAQAMTLDASGNVVIGATSTTYKLQVVGSFAATTKSFVIPHPTKEGKKLRYGSLEGPENGVYVRGKLSDNDTIELPEYWTKLVDEDSITVNLTPIGKHQKLYVKSIEDNKVIIGNENLLGSINCFYTIFAERIDVDKLEVEID